MSLLDEVTLPPQTVKPWVQKKKLESAATKLLKTKRKKTRRGKGKKRKQAEVLRRAAAIKLYKQQKKLLAAQEAEFKRLIS